MSDSVIVNEISRAVRMAYDKSQTVGGGASLHGVGGARNRGRAGYPVPQVLGTKRGAEGFDDEGFQIQEGGDTFKGDHATDRIARENIKSTVDSFNAQVLSKIGVKLAKTLGSGGTKPDSGDIDISVNADRSEMGAIYAKIQQFVKDHKMNKGLDQISVSYPQIDPMGKHVVAGGKPLTVQIDIVFGDPDYIEVSHSGVENSKYKAVYTRAAMAGVTKVVIGWAVNNTRGFYDRAVPKEQREYVTDFTRILKMINARSKERWERTDLMKSFELVWEKIVRSFTPQQVAGIRDYTIEFLTGMKFKLPSELSESVSLNEATDPDELGFGIKHLDDLKPEEFMTFLKKFADVSLSGGLEISEKVDGSAKLSFGVTSNRVWTQTKTGSRKMMSNQYPDNDIFRAVKSAHAALESKAKQIANFWPESVSFMVAEVLYTKVPNTIEYGPNVLMIHGVYSKDNKPLSDAESKNAAESVIRSVDSKLDDGKDEWKFEYKRTINPKDVMVDVKTEIDSLGELLALLRAKPRDKDARSQFKSIQTQVKRKLLTQLHKQKSAYGPEGGDVEGIVFRDLESGVMTKLVDKDYFTKLNNFMWSWRRRVDKDVMQSFKRVVAEKVLGDVSLSSNLLVKKLLTERDPKDKSGPDQQAANLIARYIKKHSLMSGDFNTEFHRALMSANKELESLKSEWVSAKGGEQRFDFTDDDTGTKKSRTMGPEVLQRSESAFVNAEAALKGIEAGVNVAGSLSNPMTKKVALFKLFMGHRFGRLVDALGYSSSVNAGRMNALESVGLRNRGPTDLSGDQRIDGQVPMADVDYQEDGLMEMSLESVIHEQLSRLLEATGESSVGATIGRYHPFHAGHATVIRELAQKFSKVLVFVAGSKLGPDNPFSYDLRVEMMKKSLPDVWSKIRVLPASMPGQTPGFVPGLIAGAQAAKEIEFEQHVTVLVGPDRYANVSRQVKDNEINQGKPGYPPTGKIDVQQLAGVKNDGDDDRISGTKVRDAIRSGDKVAVRKMLDPHLSTDSASFEDLFAKLSAELASGSVVTPKKKKTTRAKIEGIVESIMSEMGTSAGAMATSPGDARLGRSGGSWSSMNPSLNRPEDGPCKVCKNMYCTCDNKAGQYQYGTSGMRQLPLNNHGRANSDVTVDYTKDDVDTDSNLKPSDLGEAIAREFVLLKELAARKTKQELPTNVWIGWDFCEEYDGSRMISDGHEIPWGESSSAGERWIELAVDGKRQGNRSTFDILTSLGEKFEVKEPTPTGKIRLGTFALQVTSKFRANLGSAVEDIFEFIGAVSKSADKFENVTGEDSAKLSELSTLVDKFKTGTAGVKDYKRLSDSFVYLRELHSKRATDPDDKIDTPWLEGGSISRAQAVKISRMLNINMTGGDAGISSLAHSYIEHPYIIRQGVFEKEKNESMQPERLLREVVGVILVNRQKGFFVIPKERFNDTFVFDGTFQGRPLLQIIGDTVGKLQKSKTPEEMSAIAASTLRRSQEKLGNEMSLDAYNAYRALYGKNAISKKPVKTLDKSSPTYKAFISNGTKDKEVDPLTNDVTHGV